MARLHLLPISQINGKVSGALWPRTNRCTLRVLTVPLQVAASVRVDKRDLSPVFDHEAATHDASMTALAKSWRRE
jgi:hypothetical protein